MMWPKTTIIGLFICCWGFSASPTVANVVYTDDTFNLSNYSDTTYLDNASLTASQCPSCGDPGSALQVTVTTQPPFGRGSSFLINNGFTYNPSTQGAITSISASIDLQIVTHTAVSGFAETFDPIIQQGGVDYVDFITGRTLGPFNGPSGYNTISASGLTANGFEEINPNNFTTNSSLHPNFSAGQMLFGLLTGDHATASSALTFDSDSDNLTISISSAAPNVTVSTTPAGADTQYSYAFTNLTGSGDVFIPILDPAGIVNSSLPGDAILITNRATIQSDWPGNRNAIPSNKSLFDDPAALLEVPDSGASSFSFLDSDTVINGPILADGSLLDPLVPGPAAVPEPASIWLLAAGVLAVGVMRRTRRSSHDSIRAA